MPAAITNGFVITVSILLAILIAVRVIKNITAPEKTVKAMVVGKQTADQLSKYSENGKNKKFAVTFSAEDKKMTFYVSEFSYKGYKIGDKGILKYKGNRIIAFK